MRVQRKMFLTLLHNCNSKMCIFLNVLQIGPRKHFNLLQNNLLQNLYSCQTPMHCQMQLIGLYCKLAVYSLIILANYFYSSVWWNGRNWKKRTPNSETPGTVPETNNTITIRTCTKTVNWKCKTPEDSELKHEYFSCARAYAISVRYIAIMCTCTKSNKINV